MPKQKAPRPTKTNTGDYLLDFEGTDFSQFGGQQAQVIVKAAQHLVATI